MAIKIWPELIQEIDARWSKRFGGDATRLRRLLETIEHRIDLELPGRPHGGTGVFRQVDHYFRVIRLCLHRLRAYREPGPGKVRVWAKVNSPSRDSPPV